MTTQATRTADDGRGSFALFRGVLAYLDTFNGLVPCRVESVADDGAVTVKVTADRRGGYTRGEILTYEPSAATRNVIPRTAVYVRAGQYRISGNPVRAYPDSAI